MAIHYTQGEEKANVISHAIGILFGIIAGVILMQKAIKTGNSWAIGSIPLYIFGMLSSYFTSTWYHASVTPAKKTILRKFDHAAIYLHIAGTYSPILLILMRNISYWGWSLFIFVWLVAAIGLILSFTNLKEHSNLETFCFVAMGCIILIALKPLIITLFPLGKLNVLWFLFTGGIFYIIGALFYSFNKIKYMHSVFHLFCLGGSICHILAIWYAI